MLYNKNVIDVKVYVLKDVSLDAVEATIENFVSDWTTNSCPHYTREFIAETTIEKIPKGMYTTTGPKLSGSSNS